MTELVGRPMEILLVEDNPMDARLTLESLAESRIQHRLTIVHDGAEAMHFLRQQTWFARAPRPDLILLDLNLPRKDGRQLLAEIRQNKDLCQIPVVILTGSDSEDDQLYGQESPVEGCLHKPVEREKFVALVRRLKEYWHADVILPASS
ncbi:MAG: response regulator [Planctomycetales bacterium]|nr:response regulator [Planctomycetales bacterium]NIM09634.1 response regulator [Planctomycetales bacterium]NIN09117.1 response regulator [Planctomycetales bacterium]NIN78224.1 response regulator [Planctomycetales bacterium]NIO35415.1 response regulator [Planctomycetales bacterium]